MRIAVDAHSLGSRMTGNETYVLNLMCALARVDTQHQYHIMTARPETVPAEVSHAPHVRVHRLVSNSAALRIPLLLPGLARRAQAAILHVTYVAPPLLSCPTVVTIHDISYEIFPEFFSPRDRWALAALVPFSARRAARVIAISEHTRRDLVRIYGLPEDKITVTYLAAASQFHPVKPSQVEAVRLKYGLGAPYILALGNVQPRKNLGRLMQAFALLCQAHSIAHSLVVVGQAQRRASAVFCAIREHGLQEKVLFTDYVPAEDLPALYGGAELFVMPSLYEGFGLPILEAMACGTAVVCSNASALPEVAGQAALLVDPYSVEGLAGAMSRVLSDEGLRRHLACEGLERAGQFSWDKTARQTIEVYSQAALGN